MPGMKWEPAVPVKKFDNLIASPQFKNIKPFIAAYENEKRINMNFLMGWEYGRMWFEEKKKWEKLMYPPKEQGDKEILRRKYVLRNKKNKKANQKN